MRAFGITTTLTADRTTLALRGEVDLAVANDFQEVAAIALSEPQLRTLVVDLGDVTFLDSTAIGALVALHNSAKKLGKQFVLSQVPDRVETLLHITRLDTVFDRATQTNQPL